LKIGRWLGREHPEMAAPKQWNREFATEPWKFYDLGHGYCTYDFFDQCPYRMACAKCDFYLPKDSARAQLMEPKANLLECAKTCR
jgi:hypothetical protein